MNEAEHINKTLHKGINVLPLRHMIEYTGSSANFLILPVTWASCWGKSVLVCIIQYQHWRYFQYTHKPKVLMQHTSIFNGAMRNVIKFGYFWLRKNVQIENQSERMGK